MAIKTDTFEIITVRYKGKIFPADDFKGILGLRNSDWPKKLKVWQLKRLSDNKIYAMYDLYGNSRIIGFNTGNAYDEAWVYFDADKVSQKLTELK